MLKFLQSIFTCIIIASMLLGATPFIQPAQAEPATVGIPPQVTDITAHLPLVARFNTTFDAYADWFSRQRGSTPQPLSTQPLEAVDVAAVQPQSALTLSADRDYIVPGEMLTLSWQYALDLDAAQQTAPDLSLPEGWSILNTSITATSPLAGTMAVQSSPDGFGPFVISASLNDAVAFLQLDEAMRYTGERSGTVTLTWRDASVSVSVANPPSDLILRQATTLAGSRLTPPYMLITADGAALSEPAIITFNYDVLALDVDLSFLSVFQHDPAEGWFPLPAAPSADGSISAEIINDEPVAVDINDFQAATLPSLAAFQTSSFTGAASYSYPIQVPAAPEGLTPSLTLSYNSQAVDSATSTTQGGWVGLGWSLDFGGIERNVNGTYNNSEDDTYNLTVNGVGSQLTPISRSADDWYTDYRLSDENFWMARKYGRGDSYDPDSSNYNGDNSWESAGYPIDKSFWLVWDKAGNEYRFDYPTWYLEHLNNDCRKTSLKTWRWSLTSITNKAGLTTTYTYTKEQEPRNFCGYQGYYDLAVYPETITYPAANGQANTYRIEFVNSQTRTDYQNKWNYYADMVAIGSRLLYRRSFLDQIRIQSWNTATNAWDTIRTVDLNYNENNVAIFPNFVYTAGGKALTLTSITETGMNNTANPPVTFFYEDHMHLTRADNGQGGQVSFTYDTTPWYEENIENQTSISGGGYGVRWSERNTWIDMNSFALNPYGILKTNFNPGQVYRIDLMIRAVPDNGDNNKRAVYIQYGLDIDGNFIPDLDSGLTYIDNGNQWVYLTAFWKVPASAKWIVPMVWCDGACNIGSFKITPTLSRHRVTQLATLDLVTSRNITTLYSYEGASSNTPAISAIAAAYNPEQNLRYTTKPYTEFRGHSQVTVTSPTGAQSISTYHQSDLLKGRASQSQTLADGVLYQSSETTYANFAYAIQPSVCPRVPLSSDCLLDLAHTFTYTTSSTSKTYGNNGTSWLGTKTDYTYSLPASANDFSPAGELLSTLVSTADSANPNTWQPWQRTQTAWLTHFASHTETFVFKPGYAPALPVLDYRAGFPKQSVTYEGSSSNILSEMLYFYDNQAFGTAPTAGYLTSTQTLLAYGSPDVYNQADYTYNSLGNLVQTVAYNTPAVRGTLLANTPANQPRVTTTTYDPRFFTFPLSITNPLNQTVTMTYNYALGVVTSQTDANGATTQLMYDGLGRMTELWKPGATSADVTLQYVNYSGGVPFHTIATQHLPAGKSLSMEKYYNGLGQMLETKLNNVEVGNVEKTVLTGYLYDSAGRLVKQSVPQAVSLTAGYIPLDVAALAGSTTSYDALSRTTAVTAPDNTAQTMRYGMALPFQTTTATDAKGVATTSYTNVLGQTVRVQPQTGPWIQYVYNTAGQMVQVRQHTQNNTLFATTNFTYDIAGRKLTMDDPDMGDWRYAYDVLGNLTAQTDANACTTNLAYDTLNRLTQKSFSGSCSGTMALTYTYDQGTNAIGRRTSMTDPTGNTTWAYDLRGNLISESKFVALFGVDYGTYTTAYAYDSADRMTGMTYPTGEVVNYSYTNQGTVESMGSSLDQYIQQVDYDEAGRMNELLLGNGILQQNAYHAWTAQGGRLAQLTATQNAGQGADLLKMSFAYDENGNITNITDRIQGNLQLSTFTYDTLNRLTSAKAEGGGWGEYALETYGYDSLGRLWQKAGLMMQFDDPAHSHAVTGTSTGGVFDYDENGNMTTRNDQQITYDPSGKVIQIDENGKTTLYRHDGDGNRVFRQDETGEITIFIGAAFEIVIQPGAAITPPPYLPDTPILLHKSYLPLVLSSAANSQTAADAPQMRWISYFYAGAMRVAMRELHGGLPPRGTVRYLLGDHLGSTSLVLDEAGNMISEARYKPFGETRYRSTTEFPTDFQFTGQRWEESTGLYDYVARMYDPATGHFISADTMFDGWDRYAYVKNNPVIYVDPSGHSYCDSELADPYECGRGEKRNYAVPMNEVFRKYGVTFTTTGAYKWTPKEQAAVLIAIQDVGKAFADVRGNGETAAEAFIAVYGNVTFERGYIDGQEGAFGLVSSDHTIRMEEFYQSDWINPRLVIHELGHLFDRAVCVQGNPAGVCGDMNEEPISARAALLAEMDRCSTNPASCLSRQGHVRYNQNGAFVDYFGFAGGAGVWQFGFSHGHGEVWADMFLGWVYNRWDVNSVYGGYRKNYMDSVMTQYLSNF